MMIIIIKNKCILITNKRKKRDTIEEIKHINEKVDELVYTSVYIFVFKNLFCLRKENKSP